MFSEQDRTIWEERDRVLGGGPEASESPTIRQEILESWRRCAMTGITPGTDDIPYTPDLPGDSRLLRAADPVVSRLAEQLSGSPATILLADSAARIVDRRAGAHSLLSKLDNANVAPGFGYAEENTGTNGIGTALEERRLFMVKGGEHYRESLQNLACVGKPIVHPVGRKVEGILDITCSVGDTNSLMAPLVEAAVREIEQRLYDMASMDERALLEEFLRTSRRGSSAVVTLSSDLVMANPAATRMLQPADKTLLWNWACLRLGSREEFIGEIQLADATEVLAKARRLEDGRRMVGIVLELRPKIDHRSTKTDQRLKGTVPRPPKVRDLATTLSGRGRASRHLDRELDLVAEDPGPTLITGEAGAGKRYTATKLHARWAPTADLVEFDLRLFDRTDTMAWVRELASAAENGNTVLLRHLEALDEEPMARFIGFLEQANQKAWRVVVSGPDIPVGMTTRAYAHFRRRLSVVPLNQRIEEIEDIARAILGQLSGAHPPQRLQAITLQTLAAHTWPGNVRELESVLRSAATKALGGDIGLQHLPAGYRKPSSSRPLASIERAELEALLSALEECGGNKSLAAKRLGVARSTLYRKVREYGIDTERFVNR